MAEKRIKRRHRRRLSLKCGEVAAGPTRIAFTEDISVDGLFIKTPNVFAPNTKLIIELNTPDHQLVRMLGIVAWGKRVPPNMVHLSRKAGMGVHITSFLEGEEHFKALLVD